MGKSLQTTRFRNAKVFYRIFPMLKMQWEHVKILEDGKTIYMRYLQDFGIGKEESVPSYWKFETDGVFYNNTQEEIYDVVISGVLDKVIEGCNAIILTYGQTGSGKSLTAGGLRNSFKDRGIAPRLISDLFKKKELLKNRQKMCIQMSYIETSKMYISDLFNPSDEMLDAQGLKNIRALKVNDEYIAMKMLFKAEGRRKFSKDFLRSQACNGVLTLHVNVRQLNQTDPITRVSKIHVVDLAGADTYGNITAFHKNIFDIGNANLAKTQLEQFVLVLCKNISQYILVKQRLNVLIQYLGDSLNSHSILRCIGHLRTDRENLLLTISMLRFGQIIRGLKPHRLKPNVTEDKEAKLNQLQEELRELKQENHLEVMLKGGDLSTNITQERLRHMQNVAEEYLQNKTNELVVMNVTDVTTVMKVFKNLYNKLEADKIECTRAAYERAYEDALTNVKKTPSKADSLASSKGSRRGTKKMSKTLKDPADGGSLQKMNKKASKVSESRSKQSSLTTKLSETKGKSGQSLLRHKSQERSASPIKRTKTSSLNMTKRSISRRKSASSSGAMPGADIILEEMPIPPTLPDQEEAWNLFINNEEYNYKHLIEMASVSEENAKGVHKEYIEEIRNLQHRQELFDLRKYELQKAQMLRLLKKEKRDEEGNVIISDLEKKCIENCHRAQEDLVQQQENVLKSQTEFCIALENHKITKNSINEKYEQFCHEKFYISVPHLQHFSDKRLLEKIDEIDVTVEEVPQHASGAKILSTDISQYENLKILMDSETQKMLNERKKTAKWIQSCKI